MMIFQIMEKYLNVIKWEKLYYALIASIYYSLSLGCLRDIKKKTVQIAIEGQY